MRILFVCPALSQNGLGRVLSLSLLCDELGWEYRVVGNADEGIWGPVAGSTFAQCCLSIDDVEAVVADWRPDAIVAVKLLPKAALVAAALAKATSLPLVIDADDADFERIFPTRGIRARLGLLSPRRLASQTHLKQLVQLRRLARRTSMTASNPFLAERYNAVVVPHVRAPAEGGPAHASRTPVVAFVGTPRFHKGIEILRASVAALKDDGLQLVVTAPPPPDAAPWESWVGVTDLRTGERILRSADIVALPSLDTPYSRAQFPVKAVDAMLARRAVVASDLPSLRWVLGDSAVFIAPGSESELTLALQQLLDPSVRQGLGDAARRRALQHYTPAEVAPTFAEVVSTAADVRRLSRPARAPTRSGREPPPTR